MGSGASVVNISAFCLNYVLVSIIIASVAVPVRADASWCLWFCAEDVEAEEIQPNSQNMALLQAIISPNQDEASTTGDVPIVDGTSLSSESVLSSFSSDTKTIEDDQISIYVVHSGDNLPAIAKMFGVTVNTIRWAN